MNYYFINNIILIVRPPGRAMSRINAEHRRSGRPVAVIAARLLFLSIRVDTSLFTSRRTINIIIITVMVMSGSGRGVGGNKLL